MRSRQVNSRPAVLDALPSAGQEPSASQKSLMGHSWLLGVLPFGPGKVAPPLLGFLVWVLTVVVLFGSGAGAATAQEPPVSELARVMREGDRDARRDAAYELWQRGAEARDALPELIKAMSDRDEQVWWFSVQAIARIGPSAAEAIPELIEQLDQRDDQRRYRAAFALGQIGIDAREPLIEALGDRQSRVRAAAAEALGWMGSEALPARDALADRLEDDDGEVRSQAAASLSKLGVEALGPAREAVGSERAEVRVAGLTLLRLLGPTARPVSDRIRELLQQDQDPLVRAQALRAASAVEGVTEQNQRYFVEALGHDQDAVVQAGLDGLAAAAAEASGVVPELVRRVAAEAEGTGSLSPAGLQAVIYLLGRFGDESLAAAGPLVALAAAREDQREVIVDCLASMGSAAVPVLMDELVRSGETAPVVAAALSEIGDAARGPLLQAIADANPQVRSSAAMALGQLQRDPEMQAALLSLASDTAVDVRATSVAALVASPDWTEAMEKRIWQALTDEAPTVRAAAVPALLRVDAARLVESFPALIQDTDASVQVALCEVVCQRERPPSGILPALLPVVSSEVPEVRAAAVPALAAVADQDHVEEVRSAILQAGADSDAAVRVAAARACRRMTPDDRLVAALANWCRDPEPAVSQAALEALVEVGRPSEPAWSSLRDWARTSLTAEQRTALVRAAGKLSPDRQELVAWLMQQLEDGDWVVRRETMTALGDLGKDAQAAVPGLFRLLGQEQDESAAREALRRIDVAGPEAVPLLIEALKTSEGRARFYAVYLLSRSGAAGKAALPELRKLADDEDERFRGFVRSTIERLSNAEEEGKAP